MVNVLRGCSIYSSQKGGEAFEFLMWDLNNFNPTVRNSFWIFNQITESEDQIVLWIGIGFILNLNWNCIEKGERTWMIGPWQAKLLNRQPITCRAFGWRAYGPSFHLASPIVGWASQKANPPWAELLCLLIILPNVFLLVPFKVIKLILFHNIINSFINIKKYTSKIA